MIASFPLKLYNSSLFDCWIAPFPQGCEQSWQHDGASTCERGDNASLYQFIFDLIPKWVWCLVLDVHSGDYYEIDWIDCWICVLWNVVDDIHNDSSARMLELNCLPATPMAQGAKGTNTKPICCRIHCNTRRSSCWGWFGQYSRRRRRWSQWSWNWISTGTSISNWWQRQWTTEVFSDSIFAMTLWRILIGATIEWWRYGTSSCDEQWRREFHEYYTITCYW